MTMIPSSETVPMPVPTAPLTQEMPTPGMPTPALPLETATRRAIAWSESLRDEAALTLPDDIVAALEAGLPAAIAEAREDLEPVEPEEVVMALQTWADRRNLPLPEGLSLDLDVETMSAWPRVVFREAFRRAWERFSYPRVPTAAELHRYVADDVREARARLASLDTAARKLETIRMRRRWDEEARSRHAAIKAKERAREQAGQCQPAAIDRVSVGETTSPVDSPVTEIPHSAEAASTETSRDTGIPLHQPTPVHDPAPAAAVVSPTNSVKRPDRGRAPVRKRVPIVGSIVSNVPASRCRHPSALHPHHLPERRHRTLSRHRVPYGGARRVNHPAHREAAETPAWPSRDLRYC
jgi:hypothetical protein